MSILQATARRTGNGAAMDNAGLTVKEAAEELAIHEKTVRRWVKDGKLASARVQGPRGPELRIDPNDLERVRSERGRSSTPSTFGLNESKVEEGLAALLEQIAALTAEVTRQREQIGALEETVGRLLPPASETNTDAREQGSWWQRLRRLWRGDNSG